jgi:hypothetical protein
MYAPMLDKWQKQLDVLRSGKPVGPRTYEVNINADPAHMLDWDKPLREQSSRVQKTVRQLKDFNAPLGPPETQAAALSAAGLPAPRFFSDVSGAGIYSDAATKIGGRPLASEIFNEAGIPGIKYLDEGSRGVWDVRENPKGFRGQQTISPGYGGKMSEYFPTQDAAQDWINKNRTSNFVVFDPSKIDIRKKYAFPLAAGAGGMGALAATDAYQPEERM